MKRNLYIFSAIFLLLNAVSVWAVWEGNAGIASVSEFSSQGLYAKSDLFPKNTIVEIQNLETDKKIKIVIVGPANIPGIVILVSQDTANALNLKQGSLTRVRISIPPVVSETPAIGTIANNEPILTQDPDANPEIQALQNNNSNTQSLVKVPVETVVPVESSPTPTPTIESSIPEPSPIYAETTSINEVEVIPETTQEESTSLVQNIESPQAIDLNPSEITENYNTHYEEPEIVFMSETETEAETESATEPVTALAEESLLEDALDQAPVLEVAEIPDTPIEQTQESPIFEEVALVSEISLEPAEELIPEISKDKEIAIPVVPSITATVPVEQAEDSSNVDAIPLVGSIVKPQANESKTTQPDIKTPQEKSPDIQQSKPLISSPIPYITNFEKSSYYIQIGTYSELASVQKILSSYSAKYPVAVQKTESTKGDLLKVFIGPVKKDEYGAVLERFKLLGFKDAFVKKEP